MSKLSSLLVDEIAKSCLNLYNQLPKTGKPVEKEWTVLSCIVKYDCEDGNHEVVSLGTGSKCIGASKMSPKGDTLNDSHAEVFARRGFLLYLYNNIDLALEKKQSIFIQEGGLLKLKKNLEFIFYSSQLPCGDASIIPKTGEQEHFGDILQSIKRQAEGDISEIANKKLISDIDIHRTGAKCLPDSEQDPKQAGSDYHLLGRVRTKPGRGDRTLSVSCSDKMARWIHLGIQGAMLDLLLCEPVFVNHLIFGADALYSEESIIRAFFERDQKCADIVLQCKPNFYQCSVAFPCMKKKNYVRPAAGSIIWSKIDNNQNECSLQYLFENDTKLDPITFRRPFLNPSNGPKILPKEILILEVAVQGKKLGVTKKNANSLSSSLCISKYKLYEKFQIILQKHKEMKQNIFGEDPIDKISYNEMKRKSTRYIERWSKIKEKLFKTWTVKPDIWNFCVNVT